MPRYLTDLAITVEAFDLEDAQRLSDEIRRLLTSHQIIHRIQAVRVCHIEETTEAKP